MYSIDQWSPIITYHLCFLQRSFFRNWYLGLVFITFPDSISKYIQNIITHLFLFFYIYIYFYVLFMFRESWPWKICTRFLYSISSNKKKKNVRKFSSGYCSRIKRNGNWLWRFYYSERVYQSSFSGSSRRGSFSIFGIHNERRSLSIGVIITFGCCA